MARGLGWSILLAAIVALTPIDISAIKQTSLDEALQTGNATTFRPGETLPEFSRRFGMPKTQKRLWMRPMMSDIGTERLQAGTGLNLNIAKLGSRSHTHDLGHLKTMRLDGHRHFLALEREIREIRTPKREKTSDVEIKSVSGSISTSIFDDGQKSGIDPRLLSQLAKIFTWNIDLAKDLRPGDSYKILYERRSTEGQNAGSSLRILAAELLSSGKKHTAIYFEEKKGDGNYYTEEGRSLARLFLRFPLEFTRITSGLTKSRFHPILRTKRPHTGVDFAAKRGTPVRAVGHGIITEAGWNGGYGKAIAIKHDGTYLSRYAHLDRFARGINRGVSVTRGQIIGYVGSSGRATGPHLHFEFYKNQRYVNPLRVDIPAADQIDADLQRVFEDQKRMLLVKLAAAPQS